MDLAAGATKASGREGEDDVAVRGKLLRLRDDAVLAATETVREEDRRMRTASSRQVQAGVQPDGGAVGLCADIDELVGRGHGRVSGLGRCTLRGADHHDQTRQRENSSGREEPAGTSNEPLHGSSSPDGVR